jgi:hypothetical protein
VPDADDRVTLEAHLRDAHPNLLGEGHGSRVSRSPLPRDLTSVSYGWLLAVHDANHEPLYRDHADDEWRVRAREAEADDA